MMRYVPTEGWFDSTIFEFNKTFEANWEAIRNEALRLLTAGRFKDHEQSRASPEEVYKLADQWRVFSLHRKLQKQPDVEKLAPVTWGLISQIPEILTCSVGLVYFSLIPAGGEVASHISTFKIGARIRNQLCLQLPPLQAASDKLEIVVNGQARTWELGKVITFDDAYRHHVINRTSSDRLVLIYDANSP